MDLKDFGAALLRRWYFTIAIVLVSVLAGLGLGHAIGAKYSAVATAVLIPPQATADSATRSASYAPPNPLLYMSNLSQARDLLVRAMGSQQLADDFDQHDPTATYTVTSDPNSSSPVIVLTVDGKSPTDALTGLSLLQERLPGVLASIQEQVGVAKDNLITVLPLTADEQPSVNRKAQVQAGIVVIAFVLLAGLLALAYFDGASYSRSRRPRRLAPATPPGGMEAPREEVLTRRGTRAGQRQERRDRPSVEPEVTQMDNLAGTRTSRSDPVGLSRR